MYSTHAIKLPIKQQQHILRLSLFWFLFFFNSMMQEFTPRGNNCVGFFSCLCVHGRLSLAICHISFFFFFLACDESARFYSPLFPRISRNQGARELCISYPFCYFFVFFIFRPGEERETHKCLEELCHSLLLY